MARPHAGTAPPPPRRADARRNHQRLLAAATAVFTERGVDAPLDEIARRAGVGNATLYRHFPTRRELLVAVYAEEITALCAHGEALAERQPPAQALLGWLREFIAHVAGKHHLALAIPDDHDDQRSVLFDQWHQAVRTTCAALLTKAQHAGAVRADLDPADLLALASGIVLASTNPGQTERLLRLVTDGLHATPAATSPDQAT